MCMLLCQPKTPINYAGTLKKLKGQDKDLQHNQGTLLNAPWRPCHGRGSDICILYN